MMMKMKDNGRLSPKKKKKDNGRLAPKKEKWLVYMTNVFF